MFAIKRALSTFGNFVTAITASSYLPGNQVSQSIEYTSNKTCNLELSIQHNSLLPIHHELVLIPGPMVWYCFQIEYLCLWSWGAIRTPQMWGMALITLGHSLWWIQYIMSVPSEGIYSDQIDIKQTTRHENFHGKFSLCAEYLVRSIGQEFTSRPKAFTYYLERCFDRVLTVYC